MSANATLKAVVAAMLLVWCPGTLALGPADELVRDCTITPTKAEEAFRQVQCVSYISGMLDCYSVVSGIVPSVRLYCTPQKGIPVEVALDALVQWLRVHPDKASTPSRSALLLALMEKFPCR